MNLGKYQDVLFISSIFLLTDVDRLMWLYEVCLKCSGEPLTWEQ